MASKSFEVLVRRQPGYELMLTVKFTCNAALAVLSIARKGLEAADPSAVWEMEDVRPDELRGGRFTFVHPGSEKREGYSLARLSEALLARISDTEWTTLTPTTEFGFRYLQIPEEALQATPASAAVRTRAPLTASIPPTEDPELAAAAARPARGGSLLDRARHSGRPRTELPKNEVEEEPSPALAVAVAPPPGPPPGSTPDHPDARGGSLPPKPRPVASASASGAPAPIRTSSPRTRSLPGAVPARPVPVESSLADAALDDLSKDDAIRRLRTEMQKVWDLHLRLEDAEKRLSASQAREKDLLEVLGRWQERGQ